MRTALQWSGRVLYRSEFHLARVLLDYVAGIDPTGAELAKALVALLPRRNRRPS
ncbi:MAG TPA: hypothetical protein VM716_10665 [Gemmatimonadales bacterium]|nr:hypothetical protein [Gemmatimonadales bacterium]